MSLKTAKVISPGILGLTIEPYTSREEAAKQMEQLTEALQMMNPDEFPLVVVSDDSEFTAAHVNNFVWVTFTRSNPSHDMYGVKSFTENKHWGCRGSLVIDARIKPHHAPVLVEDQAIKKSVAEWLNF
jgi:4-hydroxy-3-polyprenylbenzoate decarboxylase